MTVDEILDMMSLEGRLFDMALDEYEAATTSAQRQRATESAINHIFGVLELLAGLRAEYPAGADYAITHW